MERPEEILKSIEAKIQLLAEQQHLTFNEVLEILKKRESTLPLSIFNNTALSALEAITKYLKENLHLDYREIALLLGRNYDPIAITYRNARKKMPGSLDVRPSQSVPVDIFSNKKLSILENIAYYLKQSLKLTYHEIARLLVRDDRTIWTVYHRAVEKCK